MNELNQDQGKMVKMINYRMFHFQITLKLIILVLQINIKTPKTAIGKNFKN